MYHDDWVNLAMLDDSLVIHLLLRLHQPPPPPSYPLQLHWTVRHRRSNTKAHPTRASPTTPLSWTAATSASGSAIDAYEESSLPTKHALISRSKVANPSETTTITKKSRRKKTLAELKEEENLLLKERKSLKIELASLHLTVEKHRATNESLKKLKLDLDSRQNSKIVDTSKKAVLDPPQSIEAECHQSDFSSKVVAHKVLDDNAPILPSNSSSKAQEMGNQASSSFILPDLNLPVEE